MSFVQQLAEKNPLGKLQSFVLKKVEAQDKTISICCILIALAGLLRVYFMIANDLLVEEAYYWNYAQHLDFGYLDHPPMVALLIKMSTTLFGHSEFSVRIPSLVCWLVTALYCYRLSELIQRGTGVYALTLLSVLPFFFIQALVITPDLPLFAAWSAILYYLYRALVLSESRAWYLAGICLGIGMVSKYSIALLGLPTLLYILLNSNARFWLARKEPYCAVLIALIVFSPVIYWNMTHDWASFAFQSTRRLNDSGHFTLHLLLGLIVLFLTPFGLLSTFVLLKKPLAEQFLSQQSKRNFLILFGMVPALVFALVSLSHRVKFNWVGPSLLALLPWISIVVLKLQSSKTLSKRNRSLAYIRSNWLITLMGLLIIYTAVVLSVSLTRPDWLYKQLFPKFTAWSVLTKDFYQIAQQIDNEDDNDLYFAPLDQYNIGSELLFYQSKLLVDGGIKKIVPIVGAHIFNNQSLMFQYWTLSKKEVAGKRLILISTERNDFDNPLVQGRVISESPIKVIWSHGQHSLAPVRAYYYQVVRMKDLGRAKEALPPNDFRIN